MILDPIDVEDDSNIPHIQMLYELSRIRVQGQTQLSKEARQELNQIMKDIGAQNEKFSLTGPDRIIISPGQDQWFTNITIFRVLTILCLNFFMERKFYASAEYTEV